MNEYEQKIMRNIDEYGCHVTHVFEDSDGTGFTYSTGIRLSTGQPEVIITGLGQKLAHNMINNYNRRIVAGEVFEVDKMYDGFLDGFQVSFKAMNSKYYNDFMGSCQWLYKGDDFKTLQMIWPSTSGQWPWDEDASDGYLYDMLNLYD